MEERNGWVLATFLQRLAAYLVDSVLTQVPGLVLLLALGGTLVINLEGDDGESLAESVNGLSAALTLVALASAVVLLVYFVWWLFALRDGQTPGKQLVGIRVIRDDGTPSDWGYTFVREFVIKFLVGGFLSGMTGGIYWIVDHLWALFDGDRQALHDKMVATLVVRDRR